MALSAVVSGAGKSITVTDPGVRSKTYPLLDIRYELSDVNGGKTLTIRYLSEILITSSNLPELTGFGNSILGSVDPVVSASSLGTAQGSASGGGSGGTSSTDVATGMDASGDIEAIKLSVARPQSRTTFNFVGLTNGLIDATIKSTAPIATDNALIVAAHPNSIAQNTGNSNAVTTRVVVAADSPDVLAIGNSTDVSIAPNNAASSPIKGILRGLWGFLDANIGNASDVSVASFSPAPNATIKSLLRALVGFFNNQRNVASGFNIADLQVSASASIKSIILTNLNNIPVFLQLHSKASILVLGDVPFLAWSIRVPPNSTLILGHGDLGLDGRFYATNTRFGVSSTHATYTPIATNNSLCVEFKL